ncbi:ATP-dependent DNA helicase RecG [Paratractidigestivibacter sp.]|uniref:ATP-dependent DNA helicase RecG n=1 Tax=Paratractidigestivibacter sp. TaxID=2847316 RepID=UPI002ABD7C8D|nr:ATP-dependent DNA helicase RecG [Paratractidigestivibacter sp.]
MAERPSIAIASERVQRTCALSDSVERLRYVKGARADALRRLGLTRVRDLLGHVPRRYLDFSRVTKVAFADVGAEVTVMGTVDKVELKFPRPRMQIVNLFVIDDTGVVEATFFKQPWIAEQVRKGDVVALSGKVTFAYGFKQMKAPFYEVVDGDGDMGYARVLPVYAVSEGISVPWMRRIVSTALSDCGDVCDFLPAGLVAERRLPALGRALREVHFPSSVAASERARRRLAYDELLCLQLTLLSRRDLELAGATAVEHEVLGPHMDALLAAMPFSLTDEQRAAADETLADMASPRVMNRLLLGDVGTGKTAVAAVALAACADTGTQAAMMAPTSVLARQYAEKIGPLLDAAGIRWRLVTGADAPEERAATEAAAVSGEATVFFGTTALLSERLEFARLSLVVIDEQHRFGVSQRAALRKKGPGADLLAMSATPIPRTLALSVYGDVDLSRIAHRPRAGAGITTKVVSPDNLDLAWGAVREAVAAGQQAYVICPLVDDEDDGAGLEDVPESVTSTSKSLRSAVSTLAQLRRSVLPGIECDLLTGKMRADEKDAAMERFRSGATQVLVATTVVEVGVDVPNATAMVVLDADRFGLATLHQLRGRVGRGDVSGTVYLSCAAKKGTPARERLAALEATSDGLRLAELDLKLRHEGEVLGYRQSGGVTLRICDLEADADLVELAHADARAIAGADPGLHGPEHRLLAHEVRDRYDIYFEELERS